MRCGGGDAGERRRGGAYGKASITGAASHANASASHANQSDIPCLEWLVEGSRAAEGTLHSAKRIISKSEAPHACQRGWVERMRGGAYG